MSAERTEHNLRNMSVCLGVAVLSSGVTVVSLVDNNVHAEVRRAELAQSGHNVALGSDTAEKARRHLDGMRFEIDKHLYPCGFDGEVDLEAVERIVGSERWKELAQDAVIINSARNRHRLDGQLKERDSVSLAGVNMQRDILTTGTGLAGALSGFVALMLSWIFFNERR